MAIKVILNIGGEVQQIQVDGDRYFWDEKAVDIHNGTELVATFDRNNVVGVVDEREEING